ncbi:coiled-coil domain-containing protein 114 isoform X1 [Myripristis murdjan]|uniref:coiled-coil domain-containing protein 114 isoform X1 n=2 Tax=Myripristis murdjan TaxID=586833 RepID=UPI0011763E00|nr:coiled-coil domain-containing protein 114 isoform X1 [Myripristis murdjan]
MSLCSATRSDACRLLFFFLLTFLLRFLADEKQLRHTAAPYRPGAPPPAARSLPSPSNSVQQQSLLLNPLGNLDTFQQDYYWRKISKSLTYSHTSTMDIDGTESELAKLQRQFKIMGRDLQAYNTRAQEQIRKQRQEVERLQREQEELQRSLQMYENVSPRQKGSEDAQRLCADLGQVEEELEREKQCQNELKKEISDMEKKLTELRKGTVDTHKSEAQRTQKAIRTLENKLHRATICFNEEMTANKHLREELENLQVERSSFQKLYHRLVKELQDIRKDIGKTVTLSIAAHDARVEAQSKITMMKEKAVKDLGQHNAEMKEAEKVIAHERLLKEFMTTKCSERTGQDEDQEMGRRQLSGLKEHKLTGSGEESVETLQEVFERIQAVTGEDNLDMLVTRFIQAEDQNFALFNFVNEQNTEAEALMEQINQIQAKMEQFQVERLQQKEVQQTLLRDIEGCQRGTESKAEEYEKEASVVSKTLDQIKTGLNSILSKLECDRSVLEDKLGSSAGISESNIMSYVGLVEEKTNKLLTLQAFINSKDADRDYNPEDLAMSLLGQNLGMLKENTMIQPPIIEEESLPDEEGRPLSQDELCERIMKSLQV